MNRASILISKAIRRNNYVRVTLGRFWFRIYAFVIWDICLMIEKYSETSFPLEKILWFRVIDNNSDSLCKAVSIAVTRHGIFRNIRAFLAYKFIRRYATISQLYEAAKACGEMINGTEMFAKCKLSPTDNSSNTSKSGNNNMIGQIASFLDLGISYDEAVKKIPYQNQLMMCADKIRFDYSSGDAQKQVEKISGKDMLKRKQGRK